MRYVFAFLIFWASGSAFGAGMIHMTGQLRAFDKAILQVQMKNLVYILKRSEVEKFNRLILPLKVGTDVQLEVPFRAVANVKPAK